MILLWPCKFDAFKAATAFGAFEAEAMRAPVPVDMVKVGSAPSLPMLFPTKFVEAMDRSGCLHVLLPDKSLAKSKEILSVFWKRWGSLYGRDHTLFDLVDTNALQLTLPVRLHGDEGRGPLSLLVP